MTLAEQIAAFQAKRKAAVDRMTAIMEKAGVEGATLDDSESEEYDGLDADIKSIDKHLARLKTQEAIAVAGATTVNAQAGATDQGGVQLRSGTQGSGVLSVRRNQEPGTAFTRFSLAMIRAKGNVMQAANLAKKTPGWENTPEVLNCLQFACDNGDTKSLVEKTAVAAATTSDTTWAAPLVQYQDMAAEFINLLRPMTILGKLTKLRRVPFNIRIARQTAGVTGAFVGEGLSKPVNKLAFDNITLQWYKAAVIVVLTDEVMRFSNPAIEALARQDMLDGIAQYLDVRFIDPGYGGVANVSPASITNGVTAVNLSSTGNTVAGITAAVKTMMQAFATANLSLTSGAWIMSPVTAVGLSLMRNVNDEFVFPDITVNGGTWFGLPVITSNSVQAAGSPTDQHIILIDQNEVLLADDGEIAIDMSMEASLQMNDAPSAGAQSLVSLWQNNMVGLRCERYINWRARRTGVVAMLDNVAL